MVLLRSREVVCGPGRSPAPVLDVRDSNERRPRVQQRQQQRGSGGKRGRGILFGYGPLEPRLECVLQMANGGGPVPVPRATDGAAGHRGRFRAAAGRLWGRVCRSGAVVFLAQGGRLSSLHGMGHICSDGRRHPVERVLWAALVVLAWYMAFSISMSRWQRYQHTPTVISLERDYMAWNTSFPAVTICPTADNRVDPERVDEEVQRLAREFRVENESVLREFVERLASASLYTLPDIPDTHAIPGDRFLGIIERVTATWNFSVVASLATDMSTAAYNPSLVPTLTELGMCYSFNSLVAPFVSLRDWRLGATAAVDGRGLLEVNPMDGSVFAQLSGLPGAYQLFVHGPEEVPDFQSPFLTSPEGQFKRLEVSALGVYTAPAARRLYPEQRRCRFVDEPPPPSGTRAGGVRMGVPVYSYNLCRRACRARLALGACGCVPHLYGPLYDERNARVPTCDVGRLQCVVSNLGHLMAFSDPMSGEKVNCHCLANCNDVTYVVDSDVNNPWFLGTDLKWSLSRYPRIRLRRDLLFGVSDLLVHIGSTGGLFVGCSVLSVIEIVYFFTLRLYWYLHPHQSPPRQETGSSGSSATGSACGNRDLERASADHAKSKVTRSTVRMSRRRRRRALPSSVMIPVPI